MSARQCPGTCNTPHRRNGTGAVTGDPVWCRRCQTLIRARLLDLDDQAAVLSALEGGHRSRPGERVSGSRGRPSPAPHIDDLDELLQTLLSWEDAYRGHRGLASRPRRGRFAPTLAGNIAWLAAHLDGLLAFDGAADFGREVLRLHRRLVRHTRGGRRSGRVRLPCPGCELRSLERDEEGEGIRCRNHRCGRTYTAAEYESRMRGTDGGTGR
jgi:hypothetical protein